MSKPLVALIGRPNVGKSTLFNRLAGRRIAIVEDTPGVTRDRIYADVDWDRYLFSLVDTGGIDPGGDEPMFAHMRKQAEIAMDTAQVIVFMVDGKQGATADDLDVAQLLRQTHKPVILTVNKMDNPRKHDEAYDFYSLGMGDPVPISATLGIGINDVLDAIIERLPEPEEQPEEDEAVKIAILGKPNVGKSSLANALLGQERVIVSQVPGTTRDAVDTPVSRNGRDYVLIDTAGMRRKRSIELDSIERYGVIRSLAAMRRSDVCVLVIDAADGVSEQETKIAGLIQEEGRACVIAINKWDLIQKDTHTMDAYKRLILQELGFIAYAPVLFVSALSGQRVERLWELADRVHEQSLRRITTGLLNETVNQAVTAVEPPSDKGRRLRVYYATQVAVRPPTFVLFVNDPALMHFSYERYLVNQIRKGFGFEGNPIRLITRRRSEKEER